MAFTLNSYLCLIFAQLAFAPHADPFLFLHTVITKASLLTGQKTAAVSSNSTFSTSNMALTVGMAGVFTIMAAIAVLLGIRYFRRFRNSAQHIDENDITDSVLHVEGVKVTPETI